MTGRGAVSDVGSLGPWPGQRWRTAREIGWEMQWRAMAHRSGFVAMIMPRPICKLVLDPGDHQESLGPVLEIEVTGSPGNGPRYPHRSHPIMNRMPILIACAATLAAAAGVGIGLSRPGSSGELATNNAPTAIASQASDGIASPPSEGSTSTPAATSAVSPTVTTAPSNGNAANPDEIAANQLAPLAKAPAPQTPAPVAPAPKAIAPTPATAPLPDVIRRLALQAQAEPAQPYQPQSVAIRDEIAPGSDFDRFRDQLRSAVRDRDADFLRQVADEHIKLSFGAGLTLEKRLAEPNAVLWQELDRAIGGDCAPDGPADSGFWACPASFVTEAYHPEIDPYLTVYVDGTDVAVRQLPSTNSPVVARVSNSILQSAALPWNESLSAAEDAELNAWYQASETAQGWKFVSLPDGRKGFVSSRYAYSSLGYRAIFQQDEAGGWGMTAFIAGD